MNAAVLRDQLVQLLAGGNAHVTFQDAVANFPLEKINSRTALIPYSPWELVEHMRIAQYDIFDFIKNANYVERKWPDEYWPPKAQKASEEMWIKTIKDFRKDLQALKEIAKDPQTDFTSPLPHAPTYTILREILLVADHNSYHVGQIISLRRALNIY
jgi:uncharacterized damage-inducible protein DinB